MTVNKTRWYRGVPIFGPNVHHMYSARVDVSGGGQRLAADTVEGMRGLIRETLKRGRT